MTTSISLNRIHVRANHGCWEEEAIIGGDYIVNVRMEVDFAEAAAGDDLTKTVDYVGVKELVYAEMAKREKLIETVAYRMHRALKSAFPLIISARIEVIKLNAPMGGEVESVSVVVDDRA